VEAVTGWFEGRTPEEEDFRKLGQHVQDLHHTPEAQQCIRRRKISGSWIVITPAVSSAWST